MASGCAGRSELEAAYYKCVSTFGENLDAREKDLIVGSAEDYLSLNGHVLTVTTPRMEPGVGVTGAKAAVLCVMEELDAPDDMRREATAGSTDDSGTWGNYTASWRHPNVTTVELQVSDE